MLAIDPFYLGCTVYLYPSLQDAKNGVRAGGTGFVVGVNSPDGGRYYRYVVTNLHVLDAGCRIIRFTRPDGSAGFIQTEVADWAVAVDDDLVVTPFRSADGHAAVYLSTDTFLDESCSIEGFDLFPGEEVFFYGRFVTHDGRQRNKPVMRFGNIAMLPDQDVLIDMPGGRKQLAFLVECRSLSGFSGSPAFVLLGGSRLMKPRTTREQKWIPSAVRLLGIDCGHLPFYSPVREQRNAGAKQLPGMWTETNSGIAVVIPAWRLTHLLNREDLVKEREDALRAIDAVEAVASIAVPDVVQASDDDSFTKDDFEQALRKVATRRPDSETTRTSDE